jgi:hypothetical protein
MRFALAALATFLVAVPASAQPVPTGDLPGWKQEFKDGFGRDVPVGGYESNQDCPGSSYPDTKWCPYPDGWTDTSGNGRYSPSRVMSNAGGNLRLHLHTTPDGVHRVAAPQPMFPGVSPFWHGRLYGRFAVRFRADPLHCYHTAWLLWPDSGVWPRDGEIDFPEGDLDERIAGFVHHQNGTSGHDQYGVATSTTYTNWHRAGIIWEPGKVRFYLDGVKIGQTTERVPNTPMHWVLQTETSYDCEPADATQGNVLIDWVSVYKPA